MSEHVHEGLIDHAGIDHAFRDLFEAFKHTPGNASTLFLALADRLRGHIAREELDIAKFADVDAEDAAKLLSEHAGFRTTLDELSARAKAGTLSESDVHALKLRVSLHEAHEETGLYRWAKAR